MNDVKILSLAMSNQILPRYHKVNIKLVIFWSKKSLTFMISIRIQYYCAV